MYTPILVGEAIAIYESQLGLGKRILSAPSTMPCVSALYDSPAFQKRYLEFQLPTANVNKEPVNYTYVSQRSLPNGRSDYLQLSSPKLSPPKLSPPKLPPPKLPPPKLPPPKQK